MSEDERNQAEEQAGSLQETSSQEEDEPVETPFDHPLFLPVVLLGLSVWFFYDGFLNQDPDMLEHLTFNRGGFAILSVGAAWFGYKGLKEMRERADDDSRDD